MLLRRREKGSVEKYCKKILCFICPIYFDASKSFPNAVLGNLVHLEHIKIKIR